MVDAILKKLVYPHSKVCEQTTAKVLPQIIKLIGRTYFTPLLLEDHLGIQRGKVMPCMSVVQATLNGIFSVM